MAIPTIFILLTAVFFIMQILPGDPVLIMYGERFPETYVNEIRHNLGLDRPISARASIGQDWYNS
jgi:peptide/nickel transport system permease protein